MNTISPKLQLIFTAILGLAAGLELGYPATGISVGAILGAYLNICTRAVYAMNRLKG